MSGATLVYTIYGCRQNDPPTSLFNQWSQYTVPLTTSSMSAAYVIFEGVRGSTGYINMYLDDIVIQGTASNDANLSSLTVSAGTLTPAFNANTTAYTVNVANNIASITLTATASHTAATVTGAGVKSLNVGNNVFPIIVTAENGTTSKTYTVTVNRAAPLSNDANLSSLTVSAGTLTPAFNANTTAYTVNVANNITSITLSATASHTAATVTGAGVKTLNVGANTFTITVTAENGTTQKTYSVIVTRSEPPVELTAFTLNNGAAVTVLLMVTLDYTFVGAPTHYMASESEDFAGASWTPYSPVINYYTFTSTTEGKKKVYSKLKDDVRETAVLSREILYKAPHQKPPPAPKGLNVSLYPNPAKATLNIHIEEDDEEPVQTVAVSIYSLSGQLYLSQNFQTSTFSINLSPYPAGVLLVKISSGNHSVIKQVLKD